jgi:hypothetical protein
MGASGGNGMNAYKSYKNFVMGFGTWLRTTFTFAGIKDVHAPLTRPLMDDPRLWSIQRRRTIARGEGI